MKGEFIFPDFTCVKFFCQEGSLIFLFHNSGEDSVQRGFIGSLSFWIVHFELYDECIPISEG